MGWNCKICGTYNEDGDLKCIVCDAPRATAEYKEPPAPKPAPVPKPAPAPKPAPTPKPAPPRPTPRPTAPARTVSARTPVSARVVKIIIFCIVALSYAAGQVQQYASFIAQKEVFILSTLIEKSGNLDFAITAFLGVTTIVGAMAAVLICYTVSSLCGRGNYKCAFLIAIPYCLVMAFIPSLASFLVFFFGVLFAIIKKKRVIKGFAVAFTVFAALSFASLSFAALATLNYKPDTFKYQGATYTLGEDGKYYATGYDEKGDFFTVPKLLAGKYPVGGMGSENLMGFCSTKKYRVFDLNYEHADAGDDILKVVVYNLSTTEKAFPVPVRECYTFYGWWSDANRNAGGQITDEDGKLLAKNGFTAYVKTQLYAMWYGEDYTFISSASNFKISNGGKYVLTADIDLGDNYVPVGGLSGMELQSSRRAFNGVFDGNFHSVKYMISGSRRYSGLFSWIGADGTVKNLSVDAQIAVIFTPTDKQYYAFAGGIAAINDGTIVNCRTNGSVVLKNAASVAEAGGIAGASGTDNARTGEIRNCCNYANVVAIADDAYAGGILGSAQNDGHIVSYCYNRGAVKATGANAKNTAAGGIISHGRTYAKHCFNAGSILTGYSDTRPLGGIIGFTRDTAEHNKFPEDCVWLKSKYCQATWGVGAYPNDNSGGNNAGVTVVVTEEEALKTLNADEFILKDGKVRLSWESVWFS